MSIESVMPSNHLMFCYPLLLLPLIFLSIRVFSNESVLCTRWPKDWSFSFNISPSSEYSGLISFWIDWFDLLAVQETLRSLLQHHSSKASIIWCSAFSVDQLSHPYMTTGKTIALRRWMKWALQSLYRFSTFYKVKCNFLQTFIKSLLYSRCSVYSSAQKTVVYYVLLQFLCTNHLDEPDELQRGSYESTQLKSIREFSSY